jgi:acetyl-CoA carboxylase carboxyl transferase subunit beta
MVDMVVHRHKLRATLAELCRVLTKSGKPAAAPSPDLLAVPELPPPAPVSWVGQP